MFTLAYSYINTGSLHYNKFKSSNIDNLMVTLCA